jgi:hypothetical protein
MIQGARDRFYASLKTHLWSQELAGILPLSALIDFLDVPMVLHIYQLTKAVPLWSWPITPSGARLLLARTTPYDVCLLDTFGSSPTPLCLDGRYGDKYPMTNPETLRLCLEGKTPVKINNDHENMRLNDKRPQMLEVVHVTRSPHPILARRSMFFYTVSFVGWVLLVGLVAMGILFECYLTLTFMLVVPATGCCVGVIHGGGPRHFRVLKPSAYNRMVITTMHMNETNWRVFYGESSVVNSLLNWPFRSSPNIWSEHWAPRLLLRILILGQWALVIGAATTKSWDAYLITFWIFFCIFSQSFLLTPNRLAKSWMASSLQVNFERYETELSSRRTLLNTLIALNPDTFAMDGQTRQVDDTAFCDGAMKWIDPILHEGADRRSWEHATYLAMAGTTKATVKPPVTAVGEIIGATTDINTSEGLKKDYENKYWFKFIAEGIEIASKISTEAGLTGRFVARGFNVSGS